MENIIEKAKKLAEEAHVGQFRKWSNPPQPFIVHPVRVARKVESLGMNSVAIAAASAHDILEDCGEQWANIIERELGTDVLALVRELTFPTEGKQWELRSRAEKNVVRYAQMKLMTPMAQAIKMVDRWDNLNDMKNAPRRLIQKTVDESWELLKICSAAHPEMAAELKEVIKRMENV